ncbi:MAG: hypothetical protein AB7S26_23700 [Sandaracinaceae bacterium]
MRLRGAVPTLAILLGLTLVPSLAEATLMEAMSLEQLVAESDLVAVVTCTDERASYDDRQRIVTDYALAVEEVLKGAATSRATMRRLGGEIGDIGMRIEGEPGLVPGQRYVVFLRRFDGGVDRPVGMSQGVLRIEEAAGVLRVLPGGGGLSLVQRDPTGGLRPAPSALLHPEALDAVRERIDRIVARQLGTSDGADGALRP